MYFCDFCKFVCGNFVNILILMRIIDIKDKYIILCDVNVSMDYNLIKVKKDLVNGRKGIC